MAADVFFMDLEVTSRENLPQKLARLVEKTGIKDLISPNDLVAVKLHFGEKGNTAFIRPVFIRQVIETIKGCHGNPFLTDANTLYVGTRTNAVSHIHTAIANGFSYSSMDGTPVVIADGLLGKSETTIPINQKNCKHTYIGSAVVDADVLVSVAHFKGHDLSGFGGALKNVGMGCASRKGKLDMHSRVSPRIRRKTCIGCAQCADHCPAAAITMKETEKKEEKAYLDPKKCIGCAECVVRCPTESVKINWNQTIPVFLEKMMEYAFGVLEGKKNKALFINFITDVAPKCDCVSYNEPPIVNDIGVLASTDPVAIDQAAADLVNSRQGLPGTILKTNLEPHGDKFKGLYPNVEWEHQLEHAQKLGLGSRQYRLVEIGTLSYKRKRSQG